MSHIVTIAVEVRDLAAIQSACQRLKLAEPVFGKAQLFEKEIEGILVKLPDLTRRSPLFAIYQLGRSITTTIRDTGGDQKQLDKFVQTNSIEKQPLKHGVSRTIAKSRRTYSLRLRYRHDFVVSR